ncbi:uncharacterized protein Dwil_GK22248 [Drosophila willistoni]|uniref:Hexosyltransferase n=1 Tax=Drosophila willistoni TaxID=7260 RepID=B4MYM3_DROWI|nr:beta-1,3-galactosyltransferase 1 [Drosophila willistoni]EDW77212.1 uncharacterized protein Dwil_GK22248 [Drosophila willistoni]
MNVTIENANGTREEHCALLADTSSGTTASGSEEESLSRSSKMKIRRRTVRNQRGHCPLPRSVRRLGFFTLCFFFAFVLLLIYLPLIYMDVQKRNVSLPDWTYNTSRNVRDYVDTLQDSDTATIVPREFCRKKTFLIIAVCSGLGNFVQRQTIRETWGNTTEFNYPAFEKMHRHLKGHYLMPKAERLRLYSEYLSGSTNNLRATVRIVFIVGRSQYEANETSTRLHNESEQYNDIIQENFIDSYNNLTLKSIMALKHISQSCGNSTAYFLKCDDDTFVNVPNLLHFLLGGTIPLYNDTLDYHDRSTFLVMSAQNRLNDTTEVMRGHQFCNVLPVSDISSKWYMPYYMYPRETYPKYLSGAGYLLSIDVVQRLYEASLNTSIVYLEDVYITGLCAQRAHIKRQHHPLFSFIHSKHLCSFKGTIAQHQLKGDTMVEAWNYVSDYSIECPPPGRYLNHIRLRKSSNC